MSPDAVPAPANRRDLELSRAPERIDLWIAAALFVFTFALLWATESSIGIPRDESFYFYAGRAFAGWFQLLLHDPSRAVGDAAITQFLGYNHEHPLLMKASFGLSYLVLHQGLGWLRAATAMRLPAFAAAALVPAVLHLYGSTLYDRRAGLFAALCFLAIPRQFFNAHLACFDIPIAAAWLAVVYLYWRSMTDRRYWLYCGIAFGLAVAVKHNAWFLPATLVPFSFARALRVTRGEPARKWVWGFFGLYGAVILLFALTAVALGQKTFFARWLLLSPQDALIVLLAAGTLYLLLKLRPLNLAAFRALAPLGAMALIGPAIFYLHWPYLWHHPVDRAAWYVSFHLEHVNYAWFYLGKLLREPPFPLAYVFVVTALTVPVTLLLPMAFGLFELLGRTLVAGVRRRAASLPSSSELLVGTHALAAILIISAPDVPHFGGVKHWFVSVFFLGLLGGKVVSRAADALVKALPRRPPAGSGAVTGTSAFALLASLLLAPAAIATGRVFPYGTTAYNALAGGQSGAATLGMQRQFWSNDVSGVLPWINAHAPNGAKVWLHEVTEFSFRDYQREGLLRKDLVPVGGPAEAQVAAYQYHQEFREQEFDIWQAFGTQTPAYGLYVDETPQIVVYTRP